MTSIEPALVWSVKANRSDVVRDACSHDVSAIPRPRDYRDVLIEDQVDYIANLEADVVTYRDLLCRMLAALHDAVTERDILRGQLRINRRREYQKRKAA